jgi:predicted SprT family Zn-dependent metalloprotease
MSVQDDLVAWYAGYNQKYFGDELPKDVVLDFHLHDPDKMGVTIFGTQDGFIHIEFNPEYIKSTKTLRMTLLHEMCHVQLFVEEQPDDHGPFWQSCMHRLANQKAMEDLW